MIAFVALVFLLSIYRCKPIWNKGFYTDYASRDQSRAINGICIMLILLSHTFAKVSPNDALDRVYEPMRVFIGQFVVVPFLFYSGYGMMESLTKKEGYLKSFPKKRFLKIAVQFSIITVVYILMHICLRSDYSMLHMLLSFTGITSIGNGGWFIFSTFFFYSAILVWFHVFRNHKVLATIGVAASFVVLMVAEILLGSRHIITTVLSFFRLECSIHFLKSGLIAWS